MHVCELCFSFSEIQIKYKFLLFLLIMWNNAYAILSLYSEHYMQFLGLSSILSLYSEHYMQFLGLSSILSLYSEHYMQFLALSSILCTRYHINKREHMYHVRSYTTIHPKCFVGMLSIEYLKQNANMMKTHYHTYYDQYRRLSNQS